MTLTNVANEEAELKIENVCIKPLGFEAQTYYSRQCLHSGMTFAFCVLLTVGLLFFQRRSLILELWGLILGGKIVHFGSLGGPWHLEKPNPGKVHKKRSKRRPPVICVPPFMGPFLVHFSMIFRFIFLYVFWITFGAILYQFCEPKWSQNRSKINSKFDQNFSRIFEWFLDRF